MPDLNSIESHVNKRSLAEAGIFSVALLALLLALYLPYLSGQRCFSREDLTYFYEPICRYIGEALRQGRIPLWNPYLYCGMSHIALSSPSPFYPPNIVFAFFPFSVALACLMVLHQWLAGAGMFLLIRSWGWGRLSASVAGIALSLCGYCFSLQTIYTFLGSICWIPLILWAMNCLRHRQLSWQLIGITTVTISTALMFAGGRPEIAFPALLVIVLYGLASQQTFKRAMPLMLAIAAGALISSPIMVPLWEWFIVSPRVNGLPPPVVLAFSANWYDWFGVCVANAFGDTDYFKNPFTLLIRTQFSNQPLIWSCFLGMPVLMLALCSMFDRTWKQRWFMLAGLILTGLMASAKWLPFSVALLQCLPVLGALRYPVKLMIFPILILTIMAARGVFALLQEEKFNAWMIRAMWAATLPVACLALAPICYADFAASVLHLFCPICPAAIVNMAVERIGSASLIAAVEGLTLCLLVTLFARKAISDRIFAITLPAIVVLVMVAPANQLLQRSAPADFYSKNLNLPDTYLPKHNRFYTIFVGYSYCPPNLAEESSGNDLKTYEYNKTILFPNTNMDTKIPSSFGYEGAPTGQYLRMWEEARKTGYLSRLSADQSSLHDVPLWRMCQLTATSQINGQISRVTRASTTNIPQLDNQLFDLVTEDPQLDLRAYHVRDALPRAYFSSNWKWINNEEPWLNELSTSQDADFSPAHVTLLSAASDANVKDLPSANQSAAPSATDKIEFLMDNPEHITLATESEHGRLLVLADQFYPGWQASIDKKVVPIIKANICNRAIFVPAGRHQIDFVYTPESLRSGIALLFVGVFMALIAGLLQVRLQPRPITARP
jgi:hypothetical protein